MQFERGQRVALVHTSDPHTRLRPGDQGTVRRFDAGQRRVDVTWDSGSTLSMLLDHGDDIALLPTPTTEPAPDAEDPHDVLLGAVRNIGAEDGTAAAEWWLQDTIGGRASGNTAATARRILAGIDDGDPAVLDTLPQPGTGASTDAADRDHPAANGWDHVVAHLQGEHRQSAEDAYRDGYTTAVTDTVAAACRRRLHPTGDDRDLSHLHPDNVTVGSVGVFSGDWNDAPHDAGFPLTAGYVGTLVDRWNGWAVFTCTRTVAEAIVAEQTQVRDAYRAYLAGAGGPDPDVDRQVDQTWSRMWWDGEVIVVDSTALSGDPDAVERIEPDDAGRYVVMGWSWCWQAVDPYDCSHIVGDLSDADHSREWVLLTHAPYTRVAPQPYMVTDLEPHGGGYSGALRYHGDPVATVIGITAPGTPPTLGRRPAWLAAPSGRFNPPRWQAYVAAARRCGEPMTEADLLGALAHDTLIGRSATDAVAAGDTLVRLLDDAGTIRTLVRVSPAPTTPEAFAALRDRVRTGHPDPQGVTWQYWTGHAWRHLTNTDVSTDTTQPPPAGTPDTATG